MLLELGSYCKAMMTESAAVAQWLDAIEWVLRFALVMVSCTFFYAVYNGWRDIGDAYFRSKNRRGQLWYLGDMHQEIHEYENGLEVFQELREMIRQGHGPVTEDQYNSIIQRFDDMTGGQSNHRTAY